MGDSDNVEISRRMKRPLSVDFRSDSNNNIAQPDLNPNSKRFATERNFARNNEMIVINDSDDSEDSEVDITSANDNITTKYSTQLATLKDIFPQMEDAYILKTLKRFSHVKNDLNPIISELIANPPRTSEEPRPDPSPSNSDIILMDENSNNSSKQPITTTTTTTTTTNNDTNQEIINEDLDFVLQLFPNITLTRAQIVHLIQKVYKSIQSEPTKFSFDMNTRRNMILDYVMRKKLNENGQQKVNNDIVASNPEQVRPSTSRDADKSPMDLDFEKISSVINDCEPKYIREQLQIYENKPNRVEHLLNQMLEKRNYPKLRDFLEKQKKEDEVNRHVNMELDMEEFLKLYPNPHEHFYSKVKEMSENYKSHCRTLLFNNFVLIDTESIVKVLAENNWHLTLAFRQLEDAYSGKEAELRRRLQVHKAKYGNAIIIQHMPKIKFSRKGKFYKLDNEDRQLGQYPDSLDEGFFRELCFLRNEKQIKDYIRNKELERQKKFERAKQSNTLAECICCYNNELLDEDMLPCTVEHLFCKECVKSYAETNISSCKYEFVCLEGKCEGKFDLATIKTVLNANMYSKLLRNLQSEEIKKAQIPNLESCPNCFYAAIIDNPEEKVFFCRNPDCLRETCRKCQEANHLPLRCDEIEKKQQVDMRTWIENRVTESMIRVCYQCQKRFYKTEGCNMMHCVCGASMCYVCREPIKGYDHFTKPDGCKQNTDVHEIHNNEMEAAYEKAKLEYIASHPEAGEIELKYDPKKLLDSIAKPKAAAANTVIVNVNGNQVLRQDLLDPVNFLILNGNLGGVHMGGIDLNRMLTLREDNMNRLVQLRLNNQENDNENGDDTDSDDDDDDDDTDSDSDDDNDNDSDETHSELNVEEDNDLEDWEELSEDENIIV